MNTQCKVTSILGNLEMFGETDLRRQYDVSKNIPTESHRESPCHIVFIHCNAILGVHVYNLGQVMNGNLTLP